MNIQSFTSNDPLRRGNLNQRGRALIAVFFVIALLGVGNQVNCGGDPSAPQPPSNAASAAAVNARKFYSESSFWNTPIPDNPPIDSNSAVIVASSIVPFVSAANFANTDAWG